MNIFVTPDLKQIQDTIREINILTNSTNTVDTVLVIHPDNGMEQILRDLLTASGLKFYELADNGQSEQPAPAPKKKNRGPDITIGKNGTGQYTVLDGPLTGKRYTYIKLREALDCHELAAGTHISDSKSGEKIVSAYPKTKRLHLIAAPTTQEPKEQIE